MIEIEGFRTAAVSQIISLVSDEIALCFFPKRKGDILVTKMQGTDAYDSALVCWAL